MHPVALFSILDHYLRRTETQERVIGTLLGKRSDNGEIEVRSSFAVLHSETEEQVAVDMDYLKTMYDLHHKVNPKEVIVGWYASLLGFLVTMCECRLQVLYWVESQHILRAHPQLLLARGGPPPSRTSGGEHGCSRGRASGRKSIHWVRTALATTGESGFLDLPQRIAGPPLVCTQSPKTACSHLSHASSDSMTRSAVAVRPIPEHLIQGADVCVRAS